MTAVTQEDEEDARNGCEERDEGGGVVIMAQVSVEVLAEYPFFVFGQGWSSCCPDRTSQLLELPPAWLVVLLQLLELPCARLSVGDVCISLALRNLRNGSLKKKGQHPEHLTSATSAGGATSTSGGGGGSGHGHLKPPWRAAPDRERENGVRRQQTLGIVGDVGVVVGGGGGGAAIKAENGTELRFVGDDGGAVPAGAAPLKPTRGRKRRWSAPEGRKVDKMEEEAVLPAALPRASFLPHDLKVSIEGRSSFGK
ncbi:hypothetical protein CRUP_008984 [Coryphaenoides rupestris]|nr:hypothetical protein CRUP_008984 [Coryphaenoides rupestris]